MTPGVFPLIERVENDPSSDQVEAQLYYFIRLPLTNVASPETLFMTCWIEQRQSIFFCPGNGIVLYFDCFLMKVICLGKFLTYGEKSSSHKGNGRRNSCLEI